MILAENFENISETHKAYVIFLRILMSPVTSINDYWH